MDGIQEQANTVSNNPVELAPDTPSEIKRPKYLALIVVLAIVFILTSVGIYLANSKNINLKYSDGQQPYISDKPSSTDNQINTQVVIKSHEQTTKIINPTISPEVLKNLKEQPSSNILNKILQSVYAQETNTLNMYRINTFSATTEQANELGEKFGFTGNPENVSDTGISPIFRYASDSESLIINGTNGSYSYNATPKEEGELPTFDEALDIATNYLTERNLYSTDITGSVTNPTNVNLFVSMYDKNHPYYNVNADAVRVIFTTSKDNLPVIYGDYGSENNSPYEVLVGKDGKVISVYDGAYGFEVANDVPILGVKKESQEAIDEFLATGGAVRWVSNIPGKGWSSSGKYEIRNSLITEVYQAYYYDNVVTIQHSTDGASKNTGYLLPVWMFRGTGNIYGGDFDGDSVSFISVVYAVKEDPNSTKILKVSELLTDKESYRPDEDISASFNFAFTDLTAEDRYYRPRSGLKFKFNVTYPDGQTIVVEDLIRDPNYGESIVFNSGSQEGGMFS